MEIAAKYGMIIMSIFSGNCKGVFYISSLFSQSIESIEAGTPVIGNITAERLVLDNGTLRPFVDATLVDSDNNETETLVVTNHNPSKGTLSDTGARRKLRQWRVYLYGQCF